MKFNPMMIIVVSKKSYNTLISISAGPEEMGVDTGG